MKTDREVGVELLGFIVKEDALFLLLYERPNPRPIARTMVTIIEAMTVQDLGHFCFVSRLP